MDLIIRGNRAQWGDQVFSCVVGKGGFSHDKAEGDGATPCGEFPFRSVYYRQDRIAEVKSPLPTHVIQPNFGWCDDVNHPQYNRFVELPFEGRHENLWRDDHVYDVILVVGHNDDPVLSGCGSAVFVHLSRPDEAPTQGCVAFDLSTMLHILSSCKIQSRLVVSC